MQTVCPQSTRPVETYFHLCTLWCLINHIISFTTSFQLLSIVDCDRLSQGHLSGISRRFVSFARRSRSLSWMATTALPLVDSSPPGVALVPQAPGATVDPPTNYAADSMSVRKRQCNWSTLVGSIVNQSPHRGWSTPLQTTQWRLVAARGNDPFVRSTSRQLLPRQNGAKGLGPSCDAIGVILLLIEQQEWEGEHNITSRLPKNNSIGESTWNVLLGRY